MRNFRKTPAKARVDLGDVVKVTKGAAVGRLDIGGGERLPFEGLSND